MAQQLFVSLCCLFFAFTSANASVFPLKKEVIGISELKTECITSSARKNDYCKTQIAFEMTLYTGGKFGQLSLAMWGGTDQYSSPTGACGLRFNGKNLKGKKAYIPQSNFTACYFSEDRALGVLAAMTEETRFDYYEPAFNGKSRDGGFYTSDLKLGWLTDKGMTPEILIGGYIHHIAISSKRSSYVNSFYGHHIIGPSAPWTFAKVLAKFKYYDLVD